MTTAEMTDALIGVVQALKEQGAEVDRLRMETILANKWAEARGDLLHKLIHEIAALPEYSHYLCERHIGGEFCTCGASEANEARTRARKAAGLED